MPLYNNVIRNLDKEDRKDEDKWSYEFWENVSNLPVIKQIGQYNEWSAKNQQALEEIARSGELGGLSKALQIGSDVGGSVVGLPFQAIDRSLDAVSDATNIDRRSINAALTIAGLSKAKVIPKGSPLHKSVYSAGKTAKYNVSKNVNRIKTDVGWAKDQIQYATGQKLRPMHKKPNVYTDIAEIIDGPRSLIARAKKIHEHHAGAISFAESMRRARELPDRSSSKYWYQDSELALKKGSITDPNRNDTNKLMFSTGVDPVDPEFTQLVMSMEQEGPVNYNLSPPNPITNKAEVDIPENQRFQEWTTQEIEQLGPAFKTYMGKRPYKDAATPAGMERMQKEVNATFEDLLGPDFDQDLVRGYMKAVADHEGALSKLQVIMNDKTGKLWDKQHATALRHLEHSGRMLGNKGLFPAFNHPDILDQTPLGREKVRIEREGNRPDRTARGADFQRTLARVLGKPLNLKESILYWYDQDMFYFWKELSPLQRQQLVDSSRTRSGGRIKSELTVADNINKALESMKFGKETMSGQIGRKLTPQERLKALVDNATSYLLRTRQYKGLDKDSPLQGNVLYDIETGKPTDYSPDYTGKGAYYDIDSGESYYKYNPEQIIDEAKSRYE